MCRSRWGFNQRMMDCILRWVHSGQDRYYTQINTKCFWDEYVQETYTLHQCQTYILASYISPYFLSQPPEASSFHCPSWPQRPFGIHGIDDLWYVIHRWFYFVFIIGSIIISWLLINLYSFSMFKFVMFRLDEFISCCIFVQSTRCRLTNNSFL